MTPNDIVIRDIEGQAEIRAVENLQKEVWGVPDLDVVPLSQLVAAKAAGGVLLGAFGQETLIGFAYGFPGFEHGRTTHHSHMLAVKPAYRSHNVGYRLKHAQRDAVVAQGIREMTWTFDPLQSLNAYFNFNRLGAVSDRYLSDFYGVEAASFLHRNGTDRLWVTWHLTGLRKEVQESAISGEHEIGEPLVQVGENNMPKYRDVNPATIGVEAFIEIPTRITEIERQSPELAAEWRQATRMAFIRAIDAGFVIIDFVRGSETGKYVLSRTRTFEELAA